MIRLEFMANKASDKGSEAKWKDIVGLLHESGISLARQFLVSCGQTMNEPSKGYALLYDIPFGKYEHLKCTTSFIVSTSFIIAETELECSVFKTCLTELPKYYN